MSIDLTAAQAASVAVLAEREGGVMLHQLADSDAHAEPRDIYATPWGTNHGYRIATDGNSVAIDETLPASH